MLCYCEQRGPVLHKSKAAPAAPCVWELPSPPRIAADIAAAAAVVTAAVVTAAIWCMGLMQVLTSNTGLQLKPDPSSCESDGEGDDEGGDAGGRGRGRGPTVTNGQGSADASRQRAPTVPFHAARYGVTYTGEFRDSAGTGRFGCSNTVDTVSSHQPFHHSQTLIQT